MKKLLAFAFFGIVSTTTLLGGNSIAGEPSNHCLAKTFDELSPIQRQFLIDHERAQQPSAKMTPPFEGFSTTDILDSKHPIYSELSAVVRILILETSGAVLASGSGFFLQEDFPILHTARHIFGSTPEIQKATQFRLSPDYRIAIIFSNGLDSISPPRVLFLNPGEMNVNAPTPFQDYATIEFSTCLKVDGKEVPPACQALELDKIHPLKRATQLPHIGDLLFSAGYPMKVRNAINSNVEEIQSLKLDGTGSRLVATQGPSAYFTSGENISPENEEFNFKGLLFCSDEIGLRSPPFPQSVFLPPEMKEIPEAVEYLKSLTKSFGEKSLFAYAPLSPGASGGPLLNANYEVVGVNTGMFKQNTNENEMSREIGDEKSRKKPGIFSSLVY